jgi:tetratricopeptide (TPR) repeat protein
MALDRAKAVQQAEKFVKSGKIADAITAYKKLAEDNPRDMNVFNKLGDLCVRANKSQDAIRYFLRIAEFYAKDGFLLKAIAMYKKICKLDPSNMDCVQKLAGLYQQQGLTIEAKAQYLQVIDHLIKSSQFKKAADIIPKVLEIEPENIKIRMTYADILIRTGNKDGAISEFAQVARDLAAKGMGEEAAKVAQKGLKVAPDHPELMSLMLSLSRDAKKSPDELLASVETMARANGDNPRSQALLVEAYLTAGKRSEAEAIVTKLQGIGEGAPPEVALAVGRFRLAEEDVESARQWMARAADQLVEATRGPEAAAAMDEFLRAFPEDREGLSKRADIAERANDARGLVAALHQLAQLLIRVSDVSTATEVVRRLTTLEPGNERFTEMLSSLEMRATGQASEQQAPAEELSEEPPAQQGVEALVESLELSEERDEGGGGEQSADAAEDPDGAQEAEDEEDDDFVSEHFTEAEVFVKYGLLEKAKQQLLTILAKHPRHLASHQKLKEIFYEEGNKDKAVEECLTLTELMKAKGREEEARELVNEAIRIDPNNPRVKQISSQGASQGDASAPEPAVAEEQQEAPAPTPDEAPDRPAAAPEQPEPLVAPPVAEPSPELAIEDNSGATISLQASDIQAAAEDMEIQIDMGEEPEATAPPAAETEPPPEQTVPSPSPHVAGTVERIEEETPEDIAGGLSLGEQDDAFSIEIDEEDVSDPAPAPLQPAASAAQGGKDPDAEKLGEVDFYIDQGLLEEAREVLFQLHKQYPESKEVAERFSRANRPADEAAQPPPKKAPAPASEIDLDVERAFSAPMGPPPEAKESVPRGTKARPVFRVEETPQETEGDFFDLASELDKSLSEAQVAVGGQEQESIDGPGHSLDEIFKAFKKGVEQQVDTQDYDTHYNLGIAYREMGLVDEAIGEFQYAAKDESRMVECCGILGLCFRDKGMPEIALKWYRKGLDMPGLGEHESVGLRYDIGEVFQEQGDYQKALQTFTEVYSVDSNYREVAKKLKEMRKLVG